MPVNGSVPAEFRRAYPALRRMAAAVSNRVDDPDDLVQEAVARMLARDHPPDDVVGFLRTTIAHLAIDEHRRRRRWTSRQPLIEVSARRRTLDQYPSDTDFLDRLTPLARALVWLADVEGLTSPEIGQVVGMRPAAVRQQVRRARLALREHLDAEGAHHHG